VQILKPDVGGLQDTPATRDLEETISLGSPGSSELSCLRGPIGDGIDEGGLKAESRSATANILAGLNIEKWELPRYSQHSRFEIKGSFVIPWFAVRNIAIRKCW